MVSTQLTSAAASAPTVKAADEISRLTWQTWGRGLLSDTDAQATQNVIDERKRSILAFVPAATKQPPRTPVRRPARDHRKSIARRRRISMSGLMPARLAASFSMAEIAVLSVIAREIKKQRHNLFEWPLGKISALAGCCETTARNALREARRLGIVSVTERRRNGRRSLTNIVSVTSALWRSWLRLGPRVGVGAKSSSPRSNRDNPTASAPKTTPEMIAKPRDQRGRGNSDGQMPVKHIAL